MAMLEYLEKDKEKVLAELVSAALPERAVKVLESELDRLLYQYNESEEEERLRSAASAMTETAKISLSYLNAMGEPKIWERYEDDDPNAPTKKPIPVIAWIFLLVGVAMPFAALVLAAQVPDGTFKFVGSPVTFGLCSSPDFSCTGSPLRRSRRRSARRSSLWILRRPGAPSGRSSCPWTETWRRPAPR